VGGNGQVVGTGHAAMNTERGPLRNPGVQGVQSFPLLLVEACAWFGGAQNDQRDVFQMLALFQQQFNRAIAQVALLAQVLHVVVGKSDRLGLLPLDGRQPLGIRGDAAKQPDNAQAGCRSQRDQVNGQRWLFGAERS
jgi:hypothetical protein